MLAQSLSCVPPARQLKREWSLWREFGWIPHRSMRSFKGIVCDDVSEFESYMPSQAVRSPPDRIQDSRLLEGAAYSRPE